MTSGGPISFTVPPGTAKTKLEYRATGHTGSAGPSSGECIGPPEEFCKRQHTITLDGREAATFSLWREDCSSLCTLVARPTGQGMYCQQNPNGAPSSVR